MPPGLCVGCNKDNGDGDPALECDKVSAYAPFCRSADGDVMGDGAFGETIRTIWDASTSLNVNGSVLNALGALAGPCSKTARHGAGATESGKAGTKRKAPPAAKGGKPS
ncbi:hypothetical protein BJ138DRAFT_1118557 [Hygrophoropsis aurantiaca]|uniref:Uncharacterized protein n=1 Tax=Hygrophoropsis aurantiaca TaxID=72124 RepID=A0ACB7ZXE7_9AGAM|nr:hypothetical protein BJ138DRAFT_1118557 [Hygrophoropsis aurantiaca]